MSNSIFETGDDLITLAKKAREWFESNNVAVPIGAAAWQKCSVKRNEIPPGCGVSSLRRYKFNVTTLIAEITNNPNLKASNYSPITESNIVNLLGLNWISSSVENEHKKVLTKCCNCNNEEVLDYGTLQRMKAATSKYCRYCRNVGGKSKDIEIYNIFKGFTVQSTKVSDSRIKYSCNTCNKIIERTLAHISSSEYLVCEYCFPTRNFGTRMYTELGYFDSKIEYEAYLILLKYFDSSQIERQKKYDELFKTGTKHTADFYIKPINLVLEVTSSYNNLGTKYKETAAWKLSLSKTVKFAYSLQEVEDIVRPLVKASGLTVDHSRNVLRSSIKWGLKPTKSV